MKLFLLSLISVFLSAALFVPLQVAAVQGGCRPGDPGRLTGKSRDAVEGS